MCAHPLRHLLTVEVHEHGTSCLGYICPLFLAEVESYRL